MAQNRSVGGGMELSAWFDVRVIYVRVASCSLDGGIPDALIMQFPPRDIGTELELNGGRISPSEELRLTLRRDRVNTNSSEAMYVSTDNIRAAAGTVSFAVLDRDQILLIGSIARFLDESSDKTQEFDSDRSPVSSLAPARPARIAGWKMDIACALTSPGVCSFLKGRHHESGGGGGVLTAVPTVEVCVAGRFTGSPVILQEIVQLSIRRKIVRRNTNGLHAIVEGDEGGGDGISSDHLLLAEHPEQVPLEEQEYPDEVDNKTLFGTGNLYGLDHPMEGVVRGYVENEDAGDLSWFNAGVRVGVGIGLGMCLGVGIGVGLLVRTYQATARTVRRNLF